MVSTPDASAISPRPSRLIAEAARDGAQLVVLPEYFCFMGLKDTDKLAVRETSGDGPIQHFLADAARDHGVWLIGGTLPLASRRCRPRVLNTTLVFDPDGSRPARYDKIHLFGFDKGAESLRRGAHHRARRRRVGTLRGAVRRASGCRSATTCAFPSCTGAMGDCALIVVPSAFTYTTGQAHWEVLLRARAIENQCYVLAAAQGGTHENGRRTWGHSMLIDPWGEVMAVLRRKARASSAGEIDPAHIAEVRESLPALGTASCTCHEPERAHPRCQ